MNPPPPVYRVVILGGGFGGVYTAVNLARLWRGRGDVEITLLSRDNYFLMTPLLFEAGSGVLDPRHAVTPIRRMIDNDIVRFVQADVTGVDLDRRVVSGRIEQGDTIELPYDQLVIALGGVTNAALIPGSEKA